MTRCEAQQISSISLVRQCSHGKWRWPILLLVWVGCLSCPKAQENVDIDQLLDETVPILRILPPPAGQTTVDMERLVTKLGLATDHLQLQYNGSEPPFVVDKNRGDPRQQIADVVSGPAVTAAAWIDTAMADQVTVFLWIQKENRIISKEIQFDTEADVEAELALALRELLRTACLTRECRAMKQREALAAATEVEPKETTAPPPPPSPPTTGLGLFFLVNNGLWYDESLGLQMGGGVTMYFLVTPTIFLQPTVSAFTILQAIPLGEENEDEILTWWTIQPGLKLGWAADVGLLKVGLAIAAELPLSSIKVNTFLGSHQTHFLWAFRGAVGPHLRFELTSRWSVVVDGNIGVRLNGRAVERLSNADAFLRRVAIDGTLYAAVVLFF